MATDETETVAHVQVEALFDLDQPPPIRKGTRDYLAHLVSLRYRDDHRPEGWTFWALAPIEKSWEKPHDVTLAQTEHVWLTDGLALYQAQIELDTGRIVRRRIYTPREATT